VTKEVALEQPGALAPIPFSVEDMEADANLGGKVGLADIAIPYLYILQSNSPQCNPDHAKYIEDAKAGMLYLSNLEKVYDGRNAGLVIVPCYYERLVNEWLPRSVGGGLVGSHDPEAELLKSARMVEVEPGKNQLQLPNGHQVIDTAYHYVLAQDPATKVWHQAIMPFKSTALKASRRMNSTINSTMIPNTDKRAPRFLFKWRLTTMKEQKDDQVWSSPKLEQLDMVTADVYNAAKSYALIAAKGILRRTAVEAEQEEGEQKQAKPKSTFQRDLDDEVPF
jgi:hypothetical protein